MILSCNNISKAFGSNQVIKHASFHIEDHEKAAIVGINGAGKSTLLKIIIGELPADEGDVVVSKGKSIGYLAQHQDLSGDRTVYEEVLETKRPVMEMEAKIRRLEVDMKHVTGEELEAMLT
ncbi:MAG TPA: ABC transporter, partial [Clostridium sp.]|nr:ABC transporter [Clostridium sp.]